MESLLIPEPLMKAMKQMLRKDFGGTDDQLNDFLDYLKTKPRELTKEDVGREYERAKQRIEDQRK